MIKQHERITAAENAASLERITGKPIPKDTLISGGQIENFKEGWAHNIMGGEKAHYFIRNGFNSAIAACGHMSQIRWVYGPGNYPQCTKCLRVIRAGKCGGQH